MAAASHRAGDARNSPHGPVPARHEGRVHRGGSDRQHPRETARVDVSADIDQLGFDVVDADPLREGPRFRRGTPAHDVRLAAAALEAALR